ncbi:MAG: hypothetical protein DHS20C15_33980 [Planctomycetota bacterium]|nr:MAG: hypothetical protein DHS20C15_33980 [Planctomycetota bacterium]
MPDLPATSASAASGSNSGANGVFPSSSTGVPEVGQGAGEAEERFDEEPGEQVPGSFLGALPQFFVFPLILVVCLTAIYLLLRLLAGASDATAPELLSEIRTAGTSERWFKLHELAQGVNTGRLDLSSISNDELLGFYQGTLGSLAADTSRSATERDELHYALLLVLAGKRDPSFAPVVLEALASDSETVRIGALKALGALKEPSSLAQIVPLLESSSVMERRMALDAVACLETAEAREVLVEQLRSSETQMVRNAAIWLGMAQDERATPVLLHLLDREAYGPDAGVPGDLAQLSEGSRAAARDQYVDDMMILTCRAAARLGDPAFVSVLQALRRDDRSMKVKSAALDALHDMGVDPETS